MLKFEIKSSVEIHLQGTSPTSIQSPSLSSYVGTHSVPLTTSTSFISSFRTLPAPVHATMDRSNHQTPGKKDEGTFTGMSSGALTDGEVGGELVLERGEQLLVARVRLQVHLALVRRAEHGHLDELSLGGRVLPDPARRHRRPPYQPRPAPNTDANQSETTQAQVDIHEQIESPHTRMRERAQ
jgi:hypothetical protein